MTTLICLIGIAVILLFAFAVSNNRRAINRRTVGWAFAIQFLIGAFALYIPQGKSILNAISSGVSSVIGVLGILPPNTAKTAEVPVFTGLQATINFNLAQVSV
ncbi:Na+ dependent nucleoside transporter N-terminal domain-containing protein, partial [Halioxenophilus aromaticivorans]